MLKFILFKVDDSSRTLKSQQQLAQVVEKKENSYAKKKITNAVFKPPKKTSEHSEIIANQHSQPILINNRSTGINNIHNPNLHSATSVVKAYVKSLNPNNIGLNSNNNNQTAKLSVSEDLNILSTIESPSSSSTNSSGATSSPSSSSSSYTPLSGSLSASSTNIFTSCLYIDRGNANNTNSNSNTQNKQTKLESFINNKLSSKVSDLLNKIISVCLKEINFMPYKVLLEFKSIRNLFILFYQMKITLYFYFALKIKNNYKYKKWVFK